MHSKKIVVCDLDGSLIKVDSFPLWVRFLFVKSIVELKVGMLISIIWLLFARVVLRTSHQNLKRSLMLLEYSEKLDDDFAVCLAKQLNHDVVDRLREYSDNDIILLTAAPDRYVKHLLNHLPVVFKESEASSIQNGELFDNVGRNKRRSFESLRPYRQIDVFFTDSFEDIPLMEKSKRVFLIRPDRVTLEYMRVKRINYELI